VTVSGRFNETWWHCRQRTAWPNGPRAIRHVVLCRLGVLRFPRTLTRLTLTRLACITREPSLHNAGLIPSILQQCREWKELAIESREPAAFNDDALYRRVVTEACELKRLAVNMVEVWLDDPGLLLKELKKMTLVEANRHAIGRWGRALRETKAALQNAMPLLSVATWWPAASSWQVAPKQAQDTLVAMRLCRMQGLLVDTADEVLDGSSGETMLMQQAGRGNMTSVRLLVDAGARPYAARQGQTTLTYAADAGQWETALANGECMVVMCPLISCPIKCLHLARWSGFSAFVLTGYPRRRH
jgi:hypothetical protein